MFHKIISIIDLGTKKGIRQKSYLLIANKIKISIMV